MTPYLNCLRDRSDGGSQHIASMRNKKNYPSVIIKYSLLSRALGLDRLCDNAQKVRHCFPQICLVNLMQSKCKCFNFRSLQKISVNIRTSCLHKSMEVVHFANTLTITYMWGSIFHPHKYQTPDANPIVKYVKTHVILIEVY